jgi:signal transduction histidine kinase
MSESVKQKIFNHLFTTKAVGKGTGLEMAIAQQTVEPTHGGKLSFNSVLDQYGSVKHLFLVSASRQLLQVGEPQGRTGNSIALAVPCGQPLCVYVKKLTLVTEF